MQADALARSDRVLLLTKAETGALIELACSFDLRWPVKQPGAARGPEASPLPGGEPADAAPGREGHGHAAGPPTGTPAIPGNSYNDSTITASAATSVVRNRHPAH